MSSVKVFFKERTVFASCPFPDDPFLHGLRAFDHMLRAKFILIYKLSVVRRLHQRITLLVEGQDVPEIFLSDCHMDPF